MFYIGCSHFTGDDRCHEPGSWMAADGQAYCTAHIEEHGGKVNSSLFPLFAPESPNPENWA